MASSTRKVYMLLIVVLLCFGLMVVIVSHVAPVQQLNHHVAVHIKQDVDTLMRQYRNEEIQYHLHHMPPMKR